MRLSENLFSLRKEKRLMPRLYFLFFWAARRDHLKKVVYPALREGKIVFCDRFDSSAYAYEIVAFEAPYLEELFWKTRAIFLRERESDLYLILNVDPKIALQRVKSRDEKMTHFDARELEFHERVREGFLKFVKTLENSVLIDASLPLEEVITECQSVVRSVKR